MSFAGFVGLSSDSGGLSISQALTSLSILALLNRPLAKFSIALPSIAGAVASFDRIQEYLNVSEREEKRTYARRASSVNIGEKRKAGNQVDDLMQDSVGGSTTGADETSRSDNTVSDEDIPLPKGIAVTVSASMKWPESDKAVLDIHNLKMPAGAITAVLGPTGCGKTTLLNIIMGELTAFEGTVRISSLDISYCAQKTWLPRGPIRDAILGGMEYDEELYARIIRACALTKDFAALPAGDKSLLGNKGTSLSGGQKQRIVRCPKISPLSHTRSCY